MTGMWVADATGVYRPVKAAWGVDGTGVYRPVKQGWAADGSGVYRSSYSPAPSLVVSVAAGSPAYLYRVITVQQTNAVLLAVDVVAAASGSASRLNTVQNPSATTIYTHRGNPTGSYYYRITATDAAGNISTYNTPVTNLSAVPAPAAVYRSNLDSNSVLISWAAVPAATGYEVWRTNGTPPSVSVQVDGTTTAATLPLGASTAYRFAVKALWNGYTSGYSPGVAFTSPAAPGATAGIYRYRPTTSATWQYGGSLGRAWRAMSDGVYHGNGASEGSARGEQAGFFFGYTPSWGPIAGRSCSRFRVWVYRTDDSGISAAQACRFWLHTYTGRPSGDPSSGSAYFIDAGSLARGEGKWIDLPVAWGNAILAGDYAGVAWGSVKTDLGARYMRGEAAGNTNGGWYQGELEFTIT